MAWFKSKEKKRKERREKWASHDPNLRAQMERSGEFGEDRQRERAIIDAQTQQPAQQAPAQGGTSPGGVEDEITRIAREMDERDRALDQEGQQEAEALLNRDINGMTPAQRARIQSNAQMRLNRQMQGIQREVLSSQGKRGLRGPAAYAQQRDVENLGRSAQNELYRDLEENDFDLALKKLGFLFSAGKGNVARGSLNRQRAEDQLRLRDERSKQNQYQSSMSNAFNKI